jgi:hypothetical protein
MNGMAQYMLLTAFALAEGAADCAALRGMSVRSAYVGAAVSWTCVSFLQCTACGLYYVKVESLLRAGQFWLRVCMRARSWRSGRVCKSVEEGWCVSFVR